MKQLKEQYRIINFNEFGDERGNLVVAEGSGLDVPFDIKRVFYMYGSDPGIVRGQHANRRTQFVLINVSGTSKVKVDNGTQVDIIELNKPRMGLFIDTMVWKDMYDFSEDSVLLVLASEHYDDEEYIRDYDAFVEEVRRNKEDE
jgi:dTDP-4-dehydrorhamnose 3,5-epimerase-like enzyme